MSEIMDYLLEDDVIVVVTHGMTLKAIFKVIKGISFDELGKVAVPQNTSLSIVDYTDGKYSVDIFSDVSHLGADDYENY